MLNSILVFRLYGFMCISCVSELVVLDVCMVAGFVPKVRNVDVGRRLSGIPYGRLALSEF